MGRRGFRKQIRKHEDRDVGTKKKNQQTTLEGLCWDLLQPDQQVDTCFFLFK